MTTGELVDLLRDAYDGDPWHGPSLTAALAGISAAAAAAHPVAGRHSIWQLVLHVTGWTREVTRRLDGGAPTLPQGGDWPAVPDPPTPAAWTAALEALESAHRALEGAVAHGPHPSWEAMVGDQRDPEQGTGITYGTMIVGLATHHAYHAGQISLLAPRASRAPGTPGTPGASATSASS
jgi:uncharacterized damage-inducible protein DinB